jgi:hypothetical protein
MPERPPEAKGRQVRRRLGAARGASLTLVDEPERAEAGQEQRNHDADADALRSRPRRKLAEEN